MICTHIYRRTLGGTREALSKVCVSRLLQNTYIYMCIYKQNPSHVYNREATKHECDANARAQLFRHETPEVCRAEKRLEGQAPQGASPARRARRHGGPTARTRAAPDKDSRGQPKGKSPCASWFLLRLSQTCNMGTLAHTRALFSASGARNGQTPVAEENKSKT